MHESPDQTPSLTYYSLPCADKYCSPTRRAILSGRFPNHINPGGNGQAPVCSNYLPIHATLISEKLKLAGFGTHFIVSALAACCLRVVLLG